MSQKATRGVAGACPFQTNCSQKKKKKGRRFQSSVGLSRVYHSKYLKKSGSSTRDNVRKESRDLLLGKTSGEVPNRTGKVEKKGTGCGRLSEVTGKKKEIRPTGWAKSAGV